MSPPGAQCNVRRTSPCDIASGARLRSMMKLPSFLWRPLPRHGSDRPAWQAGPELCCGPLHSRRTGLPLQSGLSRLSLQARLLRTTVLPLQAGTDGRTLQALDLALGDDLTAEILRRVDLTHKPLVT